MGKLNGKINVKYLVHSKLLVNGSNDTVKKESCTPMTLEDRIEQVICLSIR